MASTPGHGDNNITFSKIHGRNGYDDPFDIPQDQCYEALNVDFFGASLGRRRGGSKALSTTGGTAFSGGVKAIARHVPGSDETAAEFWGVDNALTVKRLVGGTAWANVTLDDAITGSALDVVFCSFNGKLFICYKSSQNRLHVWDPDLLDTGGLPIPRVRRVGIATHAAAPTVANQGGGAYAATIRYYKTASIYRPSGTTLRRSELSAKVSFTPSGAGASARVTRPTAVNEHETHWELWGSPDDTNYYLLAIVAIATTTFDDSVAPASYATTAPSGGGVAGTVPPIAGSYLPPPSAKYLVPDTARMILAGCFETTGGYVDASQQRLWWTSPLLSSNVGDDERINISTAINSYDDLGESILGLTPPQQGSFQALSYTHQWKYVATPSATAPYQRFIVAGGQGTFSNKSIVVAHDDAGYPATYWMSKRGVERYGRSGNQFVGVDISDIWLGDTTTGFVGVNLDATVPPFGVYHQDLHQIWWWVAEVGSNTPTVRVVYDTWLGRVADVFRDGAVRNGWARHTGEAAKAYCATMFSDSVGASMGRRLKPYIGYAGDAGASSGLWKCDTTDQDDNSNTFQAYVESRPMNPWGFGRQGGINEEAMLIAKALKGVSVHLDIIRDEGAETLPSDLSLTDVGQSGNATRVFPQFDASKVATANTVRFRVGDKTAVSVAQWTLDALIIPLQDEGQR